MPSVCKHVYCRSLTEHGWDLALEVQPGVRSGGAGQQTWKDVRGRCAGVGIPFFFVDGEMPEKSFLGLCCTLPGEVFADESGYHS